jgi:precorrin-2/cobalt-factor-2 C20-methyltransferase
VLDEADAVFAPVSSRGKLSVAGEIYKAHRPERPVCEFWFPMSGTEEERDGEIARQIREYEPKWRGAESVALPVIGDAALFATVAYLREQWAKICPVELRLIPGISAHSLASCVAGEFLAMAEERMSVLPGSASYERLSEAMSSSDCAAIYKPSAMRDKLPALARETGPWKKMVRVHRAGLPEQKIIRGEEAIAPTDDYLSVLLLWRNSD